MRRLLSIPGITIAFFLVWKVALLLFTTQPVPSNDAFFYDGPVVNYLLHGKYCNPSLAQVLPISGTEIFSAYPPLHQAALFGWMKCFGPTEIATVWFHVVLLAGFTLIMLAIFRELRLPPIAINFAGLFLFGITFHDRPDTLAHVFGALTVLAVVRSLMWPAAVFLLLTFCTSLQIGGIYLLWIASLFLANVWTGRAKFPWAAALAFCGALFGLIALVKVKHPLLWEGFREHVKITPSFTGLRLPHLEDGLKIIRTTPGIALALIGLLWITIKSKNLRTSLTNSPAFLVSSTGGIAALALIGGCLFILTPNTIHIAGYLQPIIVGCFLAATVKESANVRLGLPTQSMCLGAVLLVSIRAIGMTTWGILCARDVSHAQAMRRVEQEVNALTPGSTIFASGIYLNRIASRTNITWIHVDWPALAQGDNWELRSIENLQPTKLLLTQFDYFRRFETIVAQFRRLHGEVEVTITHLTQVQSPDAIPATRKIVQHISWVPVIVEFSWPGHRNGNSVSPTNSPK
jgi:hypothetical protein